LADVAGWTDDCLRAPAAGGDVRRCSRFVGTGLEGGMKRTINLLPPSFRKQQILRKRIIQWTVAICVVLVFGWLLHWYEVHEQRAQAQLLEGLAREHQPTRTMLQELVEMRQQLVDLQQQESIARELEHERNALVLLGVISDAAEKTGGRLRVTKLELTNFQHIASGDRQAARGGERATLLLSGVALDNPAVAEMLESLNDSRIFQHVELVTLKERQSDGVSLRDYQLQCEF
jgi:Tfp pilus assembly protein PilN